MRTIDVNVLSRKSIDNAIKELKEYQKEMDRKRSKFVKLVAQKMADHILDRYSTVDNKNKEKGGISVMANGAYGRAVIIAHGEGLFFLEYGTGTMATSGMGWRYGFYPGSWSVEHKDTWTEWLQSGSDEPYLYTNEAADAFVRAIGHIEEFIQEAADEVFK